MKNTIFPHKFWRPFLDCMPQLFFRPKYVWFRVHLKGPMIPDPSGQLAELIVSITSTRVDLYSHQILLHDRNMLDKLPFIICHYPYDPSMTSIAVSFNPIDWYWVKFSINLVYIHYWANKSLTFYGNLQDCFCFCDLFCCDFLFCLFDYAQH